MPWWYIDNSAVDCLCLNSTLQHCSMQCVNNGIERLLSGLCRVYLLSSRDVGWTTGLTVSYRRNIWLPAQRPADWLRSDTSLRAYAPSSILTHLFGLLLFHLKYYCYYVKKLVYFAYLFSNLFIQRAFVNSFHLLVFYDLLIRADKRAAGSQLISNSRCYIVVLYSLRMVTCLCMFICLRLILLTMEESRCGIMWLVIRVQVG